MTRIAHVSDLHLVERTYARRGAFERCRLRYLNTGRRIDPEARRAHAAAALRAASRAEHVVVTGDLTEDGLPVQFELLAEVLDAAGVDPDRVTLVPGNHDYYAAHDGFARALAGPLRTYARASAPCTPVELGGALLLPLTTAVPQSFLRSGGLLHGADLDRVRALARDLRRTLLVAQHHPPLRHRSALRQFVDGLRNAGAALALLAQHAHVHVLHGHVHARRSRSAFRGRPAQVHCAPAALESGAHVRFYDVDERGLVPSDDGAERSPAPGPAPLQPSASAPLAR